MDQRLALVGRKIKFMRIEQHYTQTGFAEMIGISQTHLSNIEGGKCCVTLKLLFRIAEVLECNVGDFFADVDTKGNKAEEVTVEDALKLLKMLKGIKNI